MQSTQLWELVRSERQRLSLLLNGLDPDQWQTTTLSQDWSVRYVAAHLAAAGSTGTGQWLLNMVLSGFSTDRHNDRLLKKYWGTSGKQTLENFNRSCNQSRAVFNSVPGLLGEIVVHGQDVAVALGLNLEPDPAAVHEVARFYSTQDFAVNSKTLIKGLKLIATDDSFTAGHGAVVRGQLLDLVMVMAGRPAFLQQLEGEAVEELRLRLV
ncbi:maleylpyruvate isomerase family mycothiol-dependent enzyme [Glutamicibacter halophytocola]|uniref:Maleylpyruvate isomerase family mycothiol-dependent enzyme n=1 Tax=Glutamicibacter halophytocola TaxID=1933880 RepID=A0AA94Y0U6_9MICC|nr:maleylpyruvate isomerase family mycothiol-dependent enzyme [Glutamicibacter halophytocola]UUX59887.1 maleylpyruvate isomerase family mycothiol-dependent enzyme [Glutamicibacter halophytocola]